MLSLSSLFDQGLILGIFASFLGCSVRYRDLFRQHKATLLYFVMDSSLACAIGFFTYVYLTQQLKASYLDAALINILVGALGSKVIDIASKVFKVQLTKYTKLMLETIVKDMKTNEPNFLERNTDDISNNAGSSKDIR